MSSEYKISFLDIAGKTNDYGVGEIVKISNSFFQEKNHIKRYGMIVSKKLVSEKMFLKKEISMKLFSILVDGKVYNMSSGFLEKS